MGQNDIIIWLIQKRLNGDHGFFTKKDIQKALGGCNVGKLVNKLRVSGFLECVPVGCWKYGFRVKASQVTEYKNNVGIISKREDFRVSHINGYNNNTVCAEKGQAEAVRVKGCFLR